jgi:UDP-3-O-[3-hydroxymyristoyl] glucosamine N-acyltransferase
VNFPAVKNTASTLGLNSAKSTMSIAEVAKVISATIVGSDSAQINAIKPLSEAGPGDLTFYAPTSKSQTAKLKSLAKNSTATAIVINESDPEISAIQIVTPNPIGAIISISKVLLPSVQNYPGIHPTAIVEETAKIGKNVSIGAFCVVGAHSEIADDCTLYPHVVVYPGVKLGKGCVLHSQSVIREFVQLGEDCLIQSGAIVGGDGFGYIPDKSIAHRRIPHSGTVILGDRVDLGANATVDRATFGTTRVGSNTKIDNLVMVGHNVQIGQAGLLCSQVGISGSSTIGNNVILAGQVGMADHVQVGDNVRAVARTGIDRDVPSNLDIGGFPYQQVNEWRRMVVAMRNLPKRMKNLFKNDQA